MAPLMAGGVSNIALAKEDSGKGDRREAELSPGHPALDAPKVTMTSHQILSLLPGRKKS